MKANKILALIAFTALILALVYGLKLAYTPKAEFLQGQVEAREYNISSKVPGRIEKVLVL
jgi:HlyD family secretion protein